MSNFQSRTASAMRTSSGYTIEEDTAIDGIAIASPLQVPELENNGYVVPILKPAFEYLQNLTAQTTTSTTPVSIGSISITPLITGNILISAFIYAQNNTLGDGITVGIYNGSTLLSSQTYTQEGSVANYSTIPISAYLTGLTLQTAITISIQINAVTGGTAGAQIIMLTGREV